MYTVEFESDASVVVSIDQSQMHEDIEMVYADNGVVYMRQYDELTSEYQLIYMSHQQWADLMAGYRSPEATAWNTHKEAQKLKRKRKLEGTFLQLNYICPPLFSRYCILF